MFERAHPLPGKTIDIWDIIATIMTGVIRYLIYNSILKKRQLNEETTNR